ncbi:hypothetical protein Mapa_005378 [Marchantia paleacea]|nr:hypothetical protein Mapa_005378 [Marchantia paleacea]
MNEVSQNQRQKHQDVSDALVDSVTVRNRARSRTRSWSLGIHSRDKGPHEERHNQHHNRRLERSPDASHFLFSERNEPERPNAGYTDETSDESQV